jgi:hypothetical protein
MSPTLTVWSCLSVVSLVANFTAEWRTEHIVLFSSEAARVSWALQHHRGFSDPYLSGPSGPTAQMAPVYPMLHAAVCMLFGTGAGGWAAILTLTALVWALQWTFAFDFLRYYGHPTAGLGAALFGVIVPLPGRLFKWEAVLTGCVLAAGACLAARLFGKPDRVKAGLFGLAAAIALLLTPATAPVFLLWGGLLVWRRPVMTAVRRLGIAFFRNYRVFGHLFFIRDDTGIALSSSNLDCAQAAIADSLASGCFATAHPSLNLAILAQLREQGEYEYAARQTKAAFRWMRSHPARFTTLTAERIIYFWFPIEHSDKPSIVTGILMSVATMASFLSIRWRRSNGFALLAGGLVSFSLTYYLVQGDQRYRYPVFWMSVLLACVGLEIMLTPRERHRPFAN